MLNVLHSLRKKKDNISDKSYVSSRGILSTKFTPDIDFPDEWVVQCDVPVIKNIFVDDCKW